MAIPLPAPPLGRPARGSVPRPAFGPNPPPLLEGVGQEAELAIAAEVLPQP